VQVAVQCGDLRIGEVRQILAGPRAHHRQRPSAERYASSQQLRERSWRVRGDDRQTRTGEIWTGSATQVASVALGADGPRQLASERGFFARGLRRWNRLGNELRRSLELADRYSNAPDRTERDRWTWPLDRRQAPHECENAV